MKSFADEPKTTIQGKLQYDDGFGVYFIDDKKEGTTYFFQNPLKDATKEFKKCVDDMKYKGNVAITAVVGIDPDGPACRVCQYFYIEKNSLCKRK